MIDKRAFADGNNCYKDHPDLGSDALSADRKVMHPGEIKRPGYTQDPEAGEH